MKPDKAKIFDSYEKIAKQEIAELRRMSATESLKRGLALITEIAKWKKSLESQR